MKMLIERRRIPILKIVTIGMLPSFLKKLYYKSRGAYIGKDVSMSFGSIIEADEIEVHDGVKIGFGTVIRGRKIKIGRFTEVGSLTFIDVPIVSLGEDALIREQVFVGGMERPDSAFHLGNRSHIRQSTMINTSRPVFIGNDSAIGGRCLIFTHGTWQSRLEGYPCTFAPVTIGNNVWVAWDVFIMPGVDIGDGVLISAGSVVTQNIPEKSLASGNPAKVVIPSGRYPRPLDSDERNSVMKEIIQESFDYLRFHGLNVKEEVGENTISARIGVPGHVSRFLYVSDINGAGKEVFDESLDIYVSMPEINNDIRQTLAEQNCMWLDLATNKRNGSTALGEEIAALFIRYGLKFERLD